MSFQMGSNTFSVPLKMHKENRDKLYHKMGKQDSCAVLLQGGVQTTRYWTDHEPLFRQESYFQYLFGAKESGCYGAIDLKTNQSYLFIERLPEAYAVWMGKIQPPEHFKNLYQVDHCYYSDELEKVLKEVMGVKKLYLLRGLNTDSHEVHQEANFKGIENFEKDVDTLHPILNECRVIKTDLEIELLRYTNLVSSRAHVEVMRQCKPGMKEYQLESLFCHHTYTYGGCRHTSYTCICGVGDHSAVLHYGHAGAPNDGDVREGDMVLLDMGAEYHCYASDITCSFPANGKFTPNQKAIYETVLKAQLEVMKAMKPGVLWPDMHRLAEKVIAEELTKIGIIQGPLDEVLKHHIPALFMPHGLGHLMGLDTHDVGGYPKGVERIQEPGIKSLRTGRVLEAGMVLTVEPGVYFIDSLLSKAIVDPVQSKYINVKKLEEFKGFGGVRLEDDVVVTANGIENLTKCPRTVEEIEAVMSGKPWDI